jgi:hypothetical protein
VKPIARRWIEVEQVAVDLQTPTDSHPKEQDEMFAHCPALFDEV